MDFKKLLFITCLFFGSTWAACIPLNLSNLNGTNYSASLDNCYEIVFDGANVSLIINNPNSTAQHQAHLNLSFTPGPSSQLYTNSVEDVNVSIGAAAACPTPNPFANISFSLGPNNTFKTQTGPGYSFSANYSGPQIATANTSLSPGGFAVINDPTTGTPISIVSCQAQAICSFAQNYTWNWSEQTFTNTTSPCNISLNIAPVPASIAYANVTANYTNPGVFFDNTHNISVVCSPQTATCPVLPSGQFNLTAGQTTTIGPLILYCPLQTQTVTQVVPYSDQYNNITAGIASIKATIPTSMVRSLQDMNDLQNGNVYGICDRQNASISQQLTQTQAQATALTAQIYDPQTGWQPRYSALMAYTYGTNGNLTNMNASDSAVVSARNEGQAQTGLWMIFTVMFGLLALLLGVAVVIRRHTSSGPQHYPPMPISGNRSISTFAQTRIDKKLNDKI